MNKQQALEKIKKLVERYDKLSDAEKKGYNEQQTKDHFIRPLFEALGWDFTKDVWSETDVHGKRVDYAFMPGGMTKFYVEAKSLKVDLDIEIHARQAINYSWNKGVAWAVLTDFEGIKIFNAQAQSKLLIDKLVFEISYSEYMSDFDRLWLLSKESFEKNGLDQYAVKHGKKIKKLTVNEKLYSDFKKAREILTESFKTWNEDVDKETLDEGVQRILDRLVFIRVLEDRKLEEPTLKPMIREWEVGGKKDQLFQLMIKKFRELDDIYNSSLFKEHACEKWEEYDDKIITVINMLYGSSVYEYDFSKIPADILGGVYESYLGYIAQNPIKVGKTGKSGKLFQTEDKKEIKTKSRQKRKEQGIYYTPKFIVDYIVENTLGKKLEEVKSMHELKKIKVLDPACGSGSFLTKALETINDKYKDFGNPGKQDTKSEIILSNIYGVDLDPQAVELAKLNLLVSALDKKAKLPDLTGNVRVGNSLISGSEKELKKYFGKEWREKRPFNWEEEFPFCNSTEKENQGFDVVIGNPPYGAELSYEDKNYFKTFDIGSTDTVILFIKKAFELLKDNGRLGLIVPKAFCFASNYKKIRNFIWDYLEEIIDCGKVWQKVKLEQVVFILRKDKKLQSYISGKIENSAPVILGNIKKSDAQEFGFFLNSVAPKEVEIAKKIKNNSIMLNDIAVNQRGAMLQKYVKDDGELEVIGGAQVQRFGIEGVKGKINKNKIDSDQAYIKENSVLVQNIVAHIENPIDHIKIISCVSDKSDYIILDTVNQISLNNKYSSYFIWSLLNSQLINWYAYRFIFGKAIRTMHFDNSVTDRLPIPKATPVQQKELIKKAKEIIKSNKQLQSIPENSDKWNLVKKEIEKVDGEIDERVFGLYGLGEEEREIIKNN
ncbi:MAG: N-6 DNA methylase [Candidatus Falkowbacteria bacterium]